MYTVCGVHTHHMKWGDGLLQFLILKDGASFTNRRDESSPAENASPQGENKDPMRLVLSFRSSFYFFLRGEIVCDLCKERVTAAERVSGGRVVK